jgi:hypothetical protein
MSKLKNMPRVVWLIIGVLVALLAVPTTAYATGAMTFTGIQGAGGGKADVTPNHQLLTAAAPPSQYLQSTIVALTTGSDSFAPVLSPGTSAAIVTTIHIDTFGDPAPGPGQTVDLTVEANSCTEGALVGTFFAIVNPGAIGETDLPTSPGLAVPAGDSLCAEADGSISTEVWVSGYTVPAAAVPAQAAGNQSPAAAQQ